jgi:DNA polymerase I-like protein with 3'-5' exonuclease and polymerase domains
METVQRTLKGGRVKEYERKCKVLNNLNGIGFNAAALGIDETKKDGVYETNVVALSKLKPKTPMQKEVVTLLFERSRLAQMKSTYFDGLLKVLIDEYAHPNINQALTKTGRTSCARPNLQNQPRGNTGPVKECFITRY